MKIPRLLTAVAVALFSSALTIETASAQTYIYPAPSPGQLPNPITGLEFLARDMDTSVSGIEDFPYVKTPDDNIFVTRVLVASFGQGSSLGLALQIDCGRGMFRYLHAPLAFRDREDRRGTPLEWSRGWMTFNQEISVGQAIMRSCEAAASDAGMDWSWNSR